MIHQVEKAGMTYEVRDEMFTLMGHLNCNELVPKQKYLVLVVRADRSFGRFSLDVKPVSDHEGNKYAVLSVQNTPENLVILNKFDAFTPVAP